MLLQCRPLRQLSTNIPLGLPAGGRPVAAAEQLLLVKKQMLDMDRQITACHRSSEMSRRLAEIPGIGPLLAIRCVYRKPKLERNGDEGRQGSRVNL